jgi:hypothetical protein
LKSLITAFGEHRVRIETHDVYVMLAFDVYFLMTLL